MESMEFEVDKKGLRSAAIVAAIAVILLVAGNFAVREGRRMFTAPALPAPPEAAAPLEAQIDDNAFYLESSSTKPIFLGAKDLKKKREALVWEKRDFAFADLDAMAMTLYASGTLRSSFPIVAKPSLGSFFAPPDGFYTIQGKATEHISKIDRGRFSWAVYLYGNYLIHAALPASKTAGILGGTASPHAGGIQLASADAKELFAFARDGMPVLVSGSATAQGVSFTYFRKSLLPHSVPEVSAASVLAADLETGEILFEKNKNDAFPIASVSKLVTALVAEERISPSRLLVVGDEALRVYGNAAGLVRGEIFRADELIYAMMLSSSNNAAKMYELAVPGFIGYMNEKAREIGMAHTSFRDSSGLSQDNVSSAQDLFTLLQYLDVKHKEIVDMTRGKSRTAASQNKLKTHVWANINWPREDKRFLGGKAGFTDDSLQTMAGIYTVRASEYGGRKIGIAVLGSRNRISDIRAVIGYLEKNFIYGSAVSKAGGAAPVVSGAAVYEAVQSPP